MSGKTIETDRLILRKIEESDIDDLYELLSEEETNTFLPFFPLKNVEESKKFYEKRIAGRKYYFAICPKESKKLVGYIKVDMNDSYEFGYVLKKKYWHRGIMTEAAKALVELLRSDDIPYITATHDRNNPRSGGVMRNIGMKYCYSYEENWQPKDFKVIFRMYQLNLDGDDDRVYMKYWEQYENHFVEEGL